MLTTTGTHGVTFRLLPNGETRMASLDPWYRWLCAMVDLYLADRISEDTLDDEVTRWESTILTDGDEAARCLLGHVFLAGDEPETTDYRARLVHILTGA